MNENLPYFDDPSLSAENSQSIDQAYYQLTEQVSDVSIKLDNICNLTIICMVGLGLIFGVLLSMILAYFLRE